MKFNYQNLEEINVENNHIKQLNLIIGGMFEDMGELLLRYEKADKEERGTLSVMVTHQVIHSYDRLTSLNSVQLDKIMKLMEEIESAIKSRNDGD